jgi:recombination associated protein RdgC
MWFKQVQLFQVSGLEGYSPKGLEEKLEKFCFQESLSFMTYGSGWVSPVDEEGSSLVQALKHYWMICLQIEEKILPPAVVRQELAQKVKKIEAAENRKVGAKEKQALKDEVIATLLPRAFSKVTKVYAYLDTQHHWLVLGTSNTKKTEQFMTVFKKTVGDFLQPFPDKKLTSVMTSWLQHQNYSSSFSVEKACVLQDANYQPRVIRCREQDLFAPSIQSLLKEGCEVKQLALNWHDHVDFVLLGDFSIQSIRFKEKLIGEVDEMEAETALQQFHADFLIMTETLNGLFEDLVNLIK